MTTAVKLSDLTDALEMSSEESGAWLDRQTGQVVVVDDDVLRAVESVDGDTEPKLGSDWQQEQLPAARAISAGDPRYLALPDKFDFHEYRYLERFIGTVNDARAADQLWAAIHDKGAFRRFKDIAGHLGLLNAWYLYRDEALTRFMLDWAEAHGIPVEKTPRQPGAS
jgi:hypothetical protein